MRNRKLFLCAFIAAAVFLGSCSSKEIKTNDEPAKDVFAETSTNTEASNRNQVAIEEKTNKELQVLQLDLIAGKYENQAPKQWGERVPGIRTSLDTTDKVIALTFDACGGPQGNGYDDKLINYLIDEQIPATLFINYRWIETNKDTFLKLSKNPLFEIANHGYTHSPLSVNGKSAYNIKGTHNVKEVIDEVMLNQNKIEELTGTRPKFFRPGTAYSDEVSINIAKELGVDVVNYNVLGDAGATFNKNQIKESCLKAQPGAIILFHMNHPGKQTYEGVKLVIPELKKRGFSFVRLSEYKLK